MISRRIHTFIIMTSLVLLLTLGIDVFAETENNDSFQTANQASVNSTVYGALSNSNDEDYYKITVSSKGYVQFAMNRIPGSEHAHF